MRWDTVLRGIDAALGSDAGRSAKAVRIAELVRQAGGYRWVGLYEVTDREIAVLGWSGPGAPADPRFPATQGRSMAAVAAKRTVLLNDVSGDPVLPDHRCRHVGRDHRPSGRSGGGAVVGTLDVESAERDAFTKADRQALERAPPPSPACTHSGWSGHRRGDRRNGWSSAMRVFVTGGTGAVGRHTIAALVQQGHTVTALARTPAKAAAVTAQGATPVSVSLFDRAALAAAFAGHDAVINLASAIPPMTRFISVKAWRNNDRVRTEGSAAVVDAVLAAGVGRLVQESVSMLYRDQGAGWVDEDAPVDRYPMARANLAAEANAHRFSQAGGRGIVVRFGWFYGPGAAHSEQLLALARRHLGLVLGPPDSYVSSIQVADAAAAVAAALGAPAGTFNIVDDEPLTKREYADALARAAGTAMWLRGPGRAGLVFGDRLTSLTRSLRVSNVRFRTATGWAPRYPSAREGWIATATAIEHRRIAA